jgi:flagellar biosynthesis/type III secretory pathway M-ring protein FliF/YscJ
MNSALKQLRGLAARFTALSTPHKILSVGSGATLLLSLAFLVYMINKPEYATLYSGLSQSDMG